MKLTTEHEQIRKTLKSFIEAEINPFVDEWEEAGIFPAHQVFKGLGDLGLLGVTKPPEYGGMGLDYSYAMAFAEELGHIHCGGVPMAIGVQTDMCTPALARFGSDELKREFLAPAIAGDQVGCIGVSETGAGSDVAALQTTARRDGDAYVINGSKMYITNGTQADFLTLLARTGEDQGYHSFSLFVVPTDLPGFSVSRKLEKLGIRINKGSNWVLGFCFLSSFSNTIGANFLSTS